MTIKTNTQAKPASTARNIQAIWMKPDAANAAAPAAQKSAPVHSAKEYYCRDRATD
jgi:hypothetical protein